MKNTKVSADGLQDGYLPVLHEQRGSRLAAMQLQSEAGFRNIAPAGRGQCLQAAVPWPQIEVVNREGTGKEKPRPFRAED